MITTAQVSSLNIDEAAEFLGMCKETLYGLASSGEVPGIKKGKEWRFLDIQLIDYIIREQTKGKETCHSSNVMTLKAPRRRTGGFDSEIQSAGKLLDDRLRPATNGKPRK
jgi:excisionase family DNA binding protein